MSAAIRTVQVEGSGPLTYDSDMPMRAIRALMAGANDGDFGEMITGLSSFVITWSEEGDPTDPEAWNDLRRIKFNDTVLAVVEDLGTLGEE